MMDHHHRSMCALMLLLAVQSLLVSFASGACAACAAAAAVANPTATANALAATKTNSGCNKCCDITCPSLLPIISGVANELVCGLVCGCSCQDGQTMSCANPCQVSVCSLLCGSCKCKAKTCPTGWTSYNGNCYQYFATPANVPTAEANCITQGGHLVSLHSDAEVAFVNSLVTPNTHYWCGFRIGHASTAPNAPVTCLSNYDQSPVDYANAAAPGFVQGTWPWCPGSPKNIHGNDDAVKMHSESGGCMNDWTSSTALSYVCKMAAGCAS